MLINAGYMYTYNPQYDLKILYNKTVTSGAHTLLRTQVRLQ